MKAKKHHAWRFVLTVIVVCGFLSAIVDMVGPFAPGTFSNYVGATLRTELEFRATEKPREVVVISVAPGSAAAKDGVLDHDRLVLPPDTSLLQFETARAGTKVRVHKPGSNQPIELTAAPVRPSTFDIEWGAIRILMLVIAVIVAFSRPERAAARALATFIACIGLFSNWTSYPGALAVVGLVLRQTAGIYGYPIFLVFAYTFAGSESHPFRERYRRLAILLGVLYGAGTLSQLFLFFASRRLQWLETSLMINVFAFFLVGVCAFSEELFRARGEMRQRILWVFATMALSLSGAVMWLWYLARPEPPVWMDNFALTTVLLPIGLAYAILRHHIFNISVAINRTLVFAFVTALLAPFFGLLEYIIVEIVKSSEHPEPISEFLIDPQHRFLAVAYAAAAVLISTALGWLHERVDHYSKEIFFRDRTHAVEEIRKACRDILYINDAKALASHVVAVLDENLKPHASAIYLRDGEFYRPAAASAVDPPPSIGGNDPAILRLKSSNETVLLGDFRTGVPGTYAIPINSGSQLGGFCSIDFGSHGLVLVDEEIEAARNLAHSAGMALDDIELCAQRQEIADLRAKLQVPGYRQAPAG